MVPGAALARQLIGLGARVIKIEDPSGGDPMRHMPPLVGGIGAGFAAYYAGAESLTLNLKDPEGARHLLSMVERADVLVESFRPGTMAAWDLAIEDLLERNSRLIVCSLPGFASQGPQAAQVGHDMNFTAATGLLDALGRAPGGVLPRVQIADVTCGLLACSAVLAALYSRERTGRGQHVEQTLLSGAGAFMTWLYADRRAGSAGVPDSMLSGRCPAYAVYACADGLELAVGAIEPKFWKRFLDIAGLPELAPVGLDTGEAGRQALATLAGRLASQPRAYWLERIAGTDLPVTPVHSADDALAHLEFSPELAVGSWSPCAEARAPELGQDTRRILDELSAPPG